MKAVFNISQAHCMFKVTAFMIFIILTSAPLNFISDPDIITFHAYMESRGRGSQTFEKKVTEKKNKHCFPLCREGFAASSVNLSH